ncbi:MAG: 2,3-bisphosphoglycerate-independent phosphoglycerate mutase, partial [Patescibacteria group bacterium]|nr:2,3-bisphosphoglycerate-independent phosphoglycerate mutase [Patescibacteria group bacterium]
TVLKDNDAVVFFNFRPDRSLQLTEAIIASSQKSFWKPKNLKNIHFVTLTEYKKGLPVRAAFQKVNIIDTLGEILAEHQEKQLRVAESEKAAHVTGFFNCGNGAPFAGEQRKILPSRTNENPAKDPVMATPRITKVIIDAVKSHAYDFILVNLANVDMISHTGDMIAAGKAIKVVDIAVGKMVEANIKANGATIITADHGNIEQMVKLNPEQDPETKHTLNPVPFIYITPDNKKNLFKSAVSSSYFSLSKIITAKDTLADVAPTVLEIMALPKSDKMTGHSLLNHLE